MTEELRLAITTIEDLLINSKLTQMQDGKSLDKINLCIPVYQRPYKWSAKNASQLLNDIIDAIKENKEKYRVGTLILHDEVNKQDKTHKYNIVDGQQRTITFSLLLKCIAEEKIVRYEKNNTQNAFFANAKKLNIPFLNQELAANNFNQYNILNNYKALQRKIRYLQNDELNNLDEYVRNRCELIVVITDDLSEAFQFFDSQNARGKALYPHDLLKAYHLREMNNLDESVTEKVVKTWEDIDQSALSGLFNEYLYRLKQWMLGNRATQLNEHNLEIFKGVSKNDNSPYAQYYKGAFSYANEVNNSHLPFVTGLQNLKAFQLNAPVIAGKPFFEYAKYYYDILADIRDNSKYEGYFINGNNIVATLDMQKYKKGIGNNITRLMFDAAILLYVDRFCPNIPSKVDLEFLDQFVIYAFVWAYSMRAQYHNVGWSVAQNFIMGTSGKELANSFNLYKFVAEADSPTTLLNVLSDYVKPLYNIPETANKKDWRENKNKLDEHGVYLNYLSHFIDNGFWEEK